MAEAGSLTEPAFAVPGGPLPDGVQLWLVRHGETTWSESGRHTGRTDLPLTAAGEAQAVALREVLADVRPAFVLCSPRQRAVATAQLAGLRVDAIDEDLAEWDYGDYEGLTSHEIRERVPGWSLWTHGVPNGETAAQVAARADHVLRRAANHLERGGSACGQQTGGTSRSGPRPRRCSALSTKRRSSIGGTCPTPRRRMVILGERSKRSARR
jgi:phosphohistidine phosphatase SixA